MEKEFAKQFGAKWDFVEKKWYMDENDYEIEKQNIMWSRIDTQTNRSQDKEKVVNDHLSTIPMEPVSQFNNMNASKKINNLLIFDLETNGLPRYVKSNIYPNYLDKKRYETCRIVQMSYILCDSKHFNIIDSKSFIIKSDGFRITNPEYHGITDEISQSKGVDFLSIVKELLPILQLSDCIVAHNLQFDSNTLKSELARYELKEVLNEMNKKSEVCSMQVTRSMVGAVNKKNHRKNPNLAELFKFSTGNEISNAHNSEYDTLHLYQSLKALKEQGKLCVLDYVNKLN